MFSHASLLALLLALFGSGGEPSQPEWVGQPNSAVREFAVQRYELYRDGSRDALRLIDSEHEIIATVYSEPLGLAAHAWLQVEANGRQLSGGQRLALLRAVLVDPAVNQLPRSRAFAPAATGLAARSGT